MTAPRELIFLYHNLSAPGFEDPLGLFSRDWKDFKNDAKVLFEIYNHSLSNKNQTSILFSFDDGYISSMQASLYLYENYGFKSDIFIITSIIGSPGFLSKDQIYNLSLQKHIRLGLHGKTHIPYTQIDPHVLEIDLKTALHDLSSIIGKSVRNISYPHGLRNKSTDMILQRLGITKAFTSIYGSNRNYHAIEDDKSLKLIKRNAILSSDSSSDIKSIHNGPLRYFRRFKQSIPRFYFR